MNHDEAIGIDVGGTKTAAVRVTARGEILARARRPTPYGSGDDLIAVLIELAVELGGARVTAVGVGLPGSVEAGSGALAFAPRPPLADVAIQQRLSVALSLPVRTDNDGNAAVWGEFRAGAAQGHDHVLLIAMGTGLGCGVISDGRLLRGARGFAVEVWQLPVEPGNPASFSELASGTAISRLGRAAAAAHPGSRLAELARGDPQRVTGEMVTQAARSGDEIGRAILEEVGRSLGRGIANLVNVFDPSIVVLGGGPSVAADLLLPSAREVYQRVQPVGAKRSLAEIVPAQLANDAAAIGAALLASEGR